LLGCEPEDDIDGDEKESMPSSPGLLSKYSLLIGGCGVVCAEDFLGRRVIPGSGAAPGQDKP
jgi:hypothetical protein